MSEPKSDAVVRARIDSESKMRATEVLGAMGLSVSDAIRLLLVRVADEKRLPFSVQFPNSATIESMEELEQGKGRRFDSAEELFQEIALKAD
ncbi:MAG: type II toxin-antitoxin system RelB/DinJ family antitoxin [Acidobacteriia bacterium]|nr:type II toxin-antitoxin system RelB/DinJ family antitoxin [Terriglobia bacterium]MYG03192.1 type II toxin-antitoxin system RelB/DinJ family antitoxin [Terriglobia bacterium]MYK09860.1 type II toxin-antitoxin system RelB/DinJ family antitoxin [Terriglobia bacterium]